MIENRFESIFNNLTDSEFEDILKECGFEFKKVEGEGGLFIGGERVYSHELRAEFTRIKQMYRKETSLSEGVFINTFNNFDIREGYLLVA